MDLLSNFLEKSATFVPALAATAIVLAILAGANWSLRRRWRDNPDLQFRFQLIMLALTFAGLLTIIINLPISETTLGQLLSLIGILLSAAIALSSTTFIGNIMAGIMLKVVKSARPGDFVTVNDLTGRITEMGLLHTEVQTEFRDLVTVPNIYMVTQPLQVVRASGTIITSEVSLGYDVSHADVSKYLCEAAKESGLTDAFVHVRVLGDYAVTYRVAGMLVDVKSLISSRSRLREHMLDTLHKNGIEIVSPTFMNQRPLKDNHQFIPAIKRRRAAKKKKTLAEDIAFDKAEEAASVEGIRKSIELVDADLAELAGQEGTEVDAKLARLEAKKTRLTEQLAIAEKERKAADLAEHAGGHD